jgi:hypothetical protein
MMRGAAFGEAAPPGPCSRYGLPQLRVRVEIMGTQKCRNVGESQSVLIMIDPIISPRTRSCDADAWLKCQCAWVDG